MVYIPHTELQDYHHQKLCDMSYTEKFIEIHDLKKSLIKEK
ncbi:MAG: hypothetical protein ABSE83_01030 [Methanobacterium sp.]